MVRLSLRRAWRCALVCGVIGLAGTLGATPLRVGVVGHATSDAWRACLGAVAAELGVSAQDLRGGSLRDIDAAIVIGGPGAALRPDERASFTSFMQSGAGIVIVGAEAGAWPEDAKLASLIGAEPAGVFAAGAALTVINLFPHPILSGVNRLESAAPVARFDKFADDAQMIIEGTSGEATTPLAWVRRRANGRLVHVVLATPALLADAGYQRLLANALRWSAARPIPNARPAVQRTFMPESYPGAFAITLPEGPSFCLDPVRGGISYVWDGDFVDLRPRWLTKQGEPARIFGDVFYRETAWQPWRSGRADGEADFRFRGYRLQDGDPEFHYEIGGREVWETFARGENGGLVRRVRVAPGTAPLWLNLEPQPGADVRVTGLERDGNVASFRSPSGGEFTIEIRRKAVVAP